MHNRTLVLSFITSACLLGFYFISSLINAPSITFIVLAICLSSFSLLSMIKHKVSSTKLQPVHTTPWLKGAK